MRDIWKSKSVKPDMFVTFLDVKIAFCVAGFPEGCKQLAMVDVIGTAFSWQAQPFRILDDDLRSFRCTICGRCVTFMFEVS